MSDQEQGEHKPSNPTISIWKGMDSLEFRVQISQVLNQMTTRRWVAHRFAQPVGDKRWDKARWGQLQPGPQGFNITAAVATGHLVGTEPLWREMHPDRLHRYVVNPSDVPLADRLLLLELAPVRLFIGPPRSLAVGFGLNPLPQLMGAAGDDVVLQQKLNLALTQRIALDGG